MNTIVFGDDGSAGADIAWLWLNSQPWPGWRVDVLSVDEPEQLPVGHSDAELEPWSPHDARPLMPDSGLERQHLRATGDPRVILGRFDDVGLITIGPTGTGFLKHVLHLGSTAEWLMHDPPSPLLIARRGARTRRVLVAADGSESANRAVRALVRLPLVEGLDIHVLGVYDRWSEPEAGVEKAASVLAETDAVVHRRVERGKATRTLLETAKDIQADLVVLGARGTSTFHRRMSGSTTAGLTRALDCNVLIVR